MVSKVLIDIDENNLPIIKVEYKHDSSAESEDLKDKLIKRFIEGFGYESNLAHVNFEEHTVHFSNGAITRKFLTIRPLKQ